MASGCLAQVVSTPQLCRAWIHESQRVFGDRLVNDQDRTWLRNLLESAMACHTSVTWSQAFERTEEDASDKCKDMVIFCDFLVPGADPKVC